MADSRRASEAHLRDPSSIVATQKRIIQFLLSILVSLVLTFVVRDSAFSPPQDYVLFLLFFSISLWITEAIPPFAVGIMIIGYLVFTLGQPSMDDHGIDVAKFVNTWSDSVIWLLLGGFFLAEGMRKTGLDRELFRMVTARSGNGSARLLLALMFTTACISMLMSNTATTAMMLAALTPLFRTLGRGSGMTRSLLIGIPASASIGGMGTIIGSAPNAIAVDMINRMEDVSRDIGFLDWMILGLPVAVTLVVILWFVLKRRFDVSGFVDLSLISTDEEKSNNVAYLGHWDSRKVVLVVMAVTVLLWLTDGLHPIPTAAVSGIPIIALTMMNIIGAEEVRRLPWDTLMLVAGGLSLGLAIEETGIMDYFLSSLKDLSLPLVLLIISFALITVISSNFMSNTAAAAILIPAASLWEGVDPVVLPLIIGMSASCALFLPVSTPPNAIAFSTGYMDQQDFRIGGLTIGLLGPILVSAWVLVLSRILF